MKKRQLIILACLFSMTICFADNPIVQTIYTADPAPMVYEGVCYVYTGHDADTLVNDFFTMNEWRCYSSTDMVNWTDLGSPLSYTNFSWAKGDCWAGQCIYRNGKFYFYVPMTQKTGGMAIGVAVASSPAGLFSDALGRPLVSTGTGDIDPSVYIDDDGQAYLYWGNPNLWWVKLNQDMISYQGSPAKIPLTTASFGVRSNTDRPTQYEEGPWFYKRNSMYYMVFAAGPISEHISYSTSTGPTGPWTFRGVVMPTQGSSFTNHPGVCDFGGRSYFFYHNGALPGGGGYHRSVCVEQFSYGSDGSIPSMNMTTTGVTQLGSLDPYTQIEAETICWESGIETEVCGEGGMDVCSIENGDNIKVKGVDFGAGATNFDARVSSATSGGNIELRLDSSTGTLVGTCAVSGTGGWQTWTTKSCTVSGASGKHDLYLKFTGGSGFLFNVNWWKFTGSGSGTPAPTAEPTAALTPAPTIAPQQNPIYSGGPFSFNGTSDYVDLPDGITSDLGDISIACWVNLSSITNWVRVFDFGGDSNIFMMFTPQSGTTGFPYFCITTSGNSGEQGINGTSVFPTGSWQHIAIIKNGTTGTLYINGQQVGANNAITLNPADLGNAVNNYIGRSQWSQDPYLAGSVDRFVVYNRAITASELAVLYADSPVGTPAPTAAPTAAPGLLGDVNGDGNINIVDALQIAQFYVGNIPSNFNEAVADTNCDGAITIVDALRVAQYYVGLINAFC